MSAQPLAIHATGLVTAVGTDAPSSCAAMRAKLTNPSPTRFMDSTGEWLLAHQVQLDTPRRGLSRLARMATLAIEETLAGIDRSQCRDIPLLLCVAEPDRPARLEGLDDRLLPLVEEGLGVRFSQQSAVLAQGRVGVASAFAQARRLIGEGAARRVAIAAVDSLIVLQALGHYAAQGRLLTSGNSNGFIPGEGAGALLVGRPSGGAQLVCAGVGFAVEKSPIDSEEPLRADGLTGAIRDALSDAGLEMHDLDYRIADLSGEQYYFKESALALLRTLHRPKAEFDLWHPAECTGEAGALAGASIVALADAASRKGYGKGSRILAHMSGDSGERAAIVLCFGSD